jgi:hypothetical protein
MKIALAVVLGFILGFIVWHPSLLRAKDGAITITQVSGTGSSSVPAVGEIVGFACTSSACFLASR